MDQCEGHFSTVHDTSTEPSSVDGSVSRVSSSVSAPVFFALLKESGRIACTREF